MVLEIYEVTLILFIQSLREILHSAMCRLLAVTSGMRSETSYVSLTMGTMKLSRILLVDQPFFFETFYFVPELFLMLRHL